MQFGVSESVAHWGKYRPKKPAIFSSGRVITYRDLDIWVDCIRERIGRVGTGRSRVAIAVEPKADFLAALVAVLRAGRSAVLLNIRLPEPALRANLEDTRPAALLHSASLGGLIKYLQPGAQAIELRAGPATQAAGSPRQPSPVPSTAEDEWGVFFSSGTTGTPKGIGRDHYSVVTELLGWCLELGITRQTAFYVGRPVFYTGGLVLALATLLVGGAIVVNDYANDSDHAAVWQDYQHTLGSQKADFAFFVPDQLRQFCRMASLAERKVLSSAVILTMGAPISGDEKVQARRLLGSMIVESWGNSESLGTITEPEDLDRRPSSVGRPFLTDEMCIVDDSCNILPPREIGRVAGAQEAGFDEYCNRPNLTDAAKRSNLIVSEDVGYVDDEGYYYICGRVQDCVLAGGATLFLPRIEETLRSVSGVAECAVVASGADTDHVELKAVVVRARPDITDQLVLGSYNSKVSAAERIYHVAFVDALPHTPSGKIDRVAVAKLV